MPLNLHYTGEETETRSVLGFGVDLCLAAVLFFPSPAPRIDSVGSRSAFPSLPLLAGLLTPMRCCPVAQSRSESKSCPLTLRRKGGDFLPASLLSSPHPHLGQHTGLDHTFSCWMCGGGVPLLELSLAKWVNVQFGNFPLRKVCQRFLKLL